MKCPKCGVVCLPSRDDPEQMFCPVDGLGPTSEPEPAPKRRTRIGVDMEVETEPEIEREIVADGFGYSRKETLITPAVLLLNGEQIIRALARVYDFDHNAHGGLTVTVEPPQEGSDQFVFTVQGG